MSKVRVLKYWMLARKLHLICFAGLCKEAIRTKKNNTVYIFFEAPNTPDESPVRDLNTEIVSSSTLLRPDQAFERPQRPTESPTTPTFMPEVPAEDVRVMKSLNSKFNTKEMLA